MRNVFNLFVLLLPIMVLGGTSVAGPNLKLPWSTGESWQLTCAYDCGYHTNSNNAYYSLDFDKPGLDEDGPDQPVLAAASGTVVFAGLNSSYGYCVKLDHGDDYVSMYAHLRYTPTVSGSINQGQQIGVMGGTGSGGTKQYADHIHFMIYFDGQCQSSELRSKSEPMSGYTNFTVTQYYTSDNFGPCSYVSQSAVSNPVYPGQSISLWVKFKNEGTATWSKTGGQPNYVELASCDLYGTTGTSFFNFPCGSASGWLNCQVPATFDEAPIGPGDTATFFFSGVVKEYSPLGSQQAYFGPVHSNAIIPGWGQMQYTVNVASPSGNSFSSEYTLWPLVGDWDHDGVVEVGAYCVNESNVYRDGVFDGVAESSIHFGTTGDTCLVGDLNGDGEADWMLFRPSAQDFYGDYNHDGQADINVHFGASGDIPLIGDWDGDDTCTFGVFRPSTQYFYLRNNMDGSSDVSIHFGASGDQPLTGDFNGNGMTDIGLYRPSAQDFYLDTNKNGYADISVHFGAPGDIPLIGDWNGDDSMSIGLYRPSNNYFYLDNRNDGTADVAVVFGTTGDIPLVGDWNADGKDNFAVYRPSNKYFYFDYDNGGETADRYFLFCKASGLPKTSTPIEEQVPQSFSLSQNYPNPFNPTTVISYSLPNATHVKLSIFNVLGQTVSTLVETEQTAGGHTAVWDASQEPSGIYFYKLEAGGVVETRKMLLLK